MVEVKKKPVAKKVTKKPTKHVIFTKKGNFFVDEKPLKYINKFANSLKDVARMPVGRESLVDAINASLMRPEMNNVALLGPAGVGKTALVEGFSMLHKNDDTLVLAASLPVMAGEGQDKFSERIHNLSEDVMKLVDAREADGIHDDVILFLDEMHLLTMSGSSGRGGGSMAGNAIKPMMARGIIKIIGATTDEEFIRYIKPDQALTRRFQTLNVPEPNTEVCIKILTKFGHTYLNDEQYKYYIPDEHVYEQIVDYTNRYLPAFAQPAKSIDIMDAAVGHMRSRNQVLNHEMLFEIFHEKANVDINWHTDIGRVIPKIKDRVIGQDLAIDMIENRLYTANAGLQDPGRPLANFMFVGSTGVGKTELVKAIAEAMFGGEDKIIRFDMSEFSLPEDVRDFQSRISEDISKQPYSVVLLDEFEKAHRSVMNLLLAILDDGRLSDQYGRETTFTNAIIVLTSNAAADVFRDAKRQSLDMESVDALLRDSLGNRFSPEFLGRFDEIIPFAPLDSNGFLEIAKLQLNKQVKKMKVRFNVDMQFSENVGKYLVTERFAALKDTSAGGGRAMKRRIEREVIPLMGRVLDVAYQKNYTVQKLYIHVAGTMRADDISLVKGNAYLEAKFRVVDKSGPTPRYFDSVISFKQSEAMFTEVFAR